MIEVYDTENRIKKFLSAGKSPNNMLGQGAGVVISDEFKEMSMHFNVLSFTHVELGTKHGMAISKD